MRKYRIFAGVWLLALLIGAVPVMGQGGPDAYASYPLNMRSGPGPNYRVVAVIPAGTALVFEGHNADLSWLLGHTEDGAYRGWVNVLYLEYTPGFAAVSLPVSDEVVAAPAPAAAARPTSSGDSASAASSLDMGSVISVGSRTREIYLRGQELGNDPRGITKIGECNSMSYALLRPFGTGEYELGPYSYLQSTIDAFPASSFTHQSVAAQAGLTSNTLLDPSWADPNACKSGQSLLECEYDRSRASVAFIMLGLQDVFFLSPSEYEQAMRRIIEISIDRGVIPVLTTIPAPPGDYRSESRMALNRILIGLAQEYGVPLMNFWQATQSVAQGGIGVDFVHVTERGDNWTSFNGDETQWGFTMWNLVALQMLEQLLGVMG